MLKIDTVFSGGGMKAYSFIGVLESLEERDIKIVRTAGTSAGAIISTLVAANYTAHEIKHFLMTLHAKKLLDAPRLTTVLPFSKWMYLDRKSTRLNSSHVAISYAVFCLKKKKITNKHHLGE